MLPRYVDAFRCHIDVMMLLMLLITMAADYDAGTYAAYATVNIPPRRHVTSAMSASLSSRRRYDAMPAADMLLLLLRRQLPDVAAA